MRLSGEWPDESSDALYRAVRAAFALRGSNLAAWCKEHEINQAWAHQALLGHRQGRAAKALCKRIVKDLKGDAS